MKSLKNTEGAGLELTIMRNYNNRIKFNRGT